MFRPLIVLSTCLMCFGCDVNIEGPPTQNEIVYTDKETIDRAFIEADAIFAFMEDSYNGRVCFELSGTRERYYTINDWASYHPNYKIIKIEKVPSSEYASEYYKVYVSITD